MCPRPCPAPSPSFPGATLNLPCLVVTYFRDIKDPGTFRAIGVDLIRDLTLDHKPALPSCPNFHSLIHVGALFSVSLDSILLSEPSVHSHQLCCLLLVPLPQNPVPRANFAQQSGWQGDKLSFPSASQGRASTLLDPKPGTRLVWRQPNLELFPTSSTLREKFCDLHKHLALFWGPHGHPGPQCLPAAMEKQSPQTCTGSPGLQARDTKAKQTTET